MRRSLWPLLAWVVLAVGEPVVFPEPQPAQIPEHILLRLNEVHNVSELFDQFLTIPRGMGNPLEDLVSRRNDPLDSSVASPAGCKPELQVVPLVPPGSDLAMLTWPACTRVERCGGCCSSELLHCAPVKTSVLHVKAVKARYRPTRDDRLEFEGYQTYQIQRHERCKCQCKQTVHDCSAAQVYQPDQCRCVCAASAEPCRGPDHYWDIKECKCRCKNILQCSSGFTFSTNTCRCTSNPPPREDAIRFPSSEDLRYRRT